MKPASFSSLLLPGIHSGQFGGDPGDQVTLKNMATPDWLKLTYGTPIVVSPTAHELVIYEITSSPGGVDTEGTSFQVRFNGGPLFMASSATAVSFYDTPPPGTAASENTIQIVFDLYDFGFADGDSFGMLYIENTNSGAGTSDPDFIFAGIAGTLAAAVPAPGSTVLLLAGCTLLLASRFGSRSRRAP